MHPRLLFAATTLLLAGCDRATPTGPEPARPDGAPSLAVTLNETYTTGQFAITCEGTEVILQGRFHLLLSATEDAAGGTHVFGTINAMDFVGTDVATGEMHRFVLTGPRHTNVNASGVTNDTAIQAFLNVSAGPGDNLLIHYTVHLTVNANGEVTADTFEFRFVCVG